ncbi:hypothetical protein [Levilactobacillus bambusae]|uniref:Uncharacterized protein n=1 Tax=Levilactobacillus bambusae TaxID=2024736 RepID=A0A2V1N0G3_9LACO|nr:hypothetical protein [Levilactobacillus bambusae]PWF99914.1 hypothetical protein DCM90_02885 [Levilactobacillus bambusae]
MDSQGIYRQLKGHEWIFMANGIQRVKMGKNGGVLAIEFLENGELSSESNMKFWPASRCWRFNETQQIIELLNLEGTVVERFEKPKGYGNRVMMRQVNGKDTYEYRVTTDSIRNQVLAPEPIQMNLGNALTKERVDLVIQLGGGSESPLMRSMSDLGLSGIKFDADLDTRLGWLSLYWELFAHPEVNRLAIVDSNYTLLMDPFPHVKANRIYLDDQLEIGTLGNGQRVQKLLRTVLIGDRAILLELSSALLNRLTPDKITLAAFNEVIYEGFSDRLIHGRLVTQKPLICIQGGWLVRKESGDDEVGY